MYTKINEDGLMALWEIKQIGQTYGWAGGKTHVKRVLIEGRLMNPCSGLKWKLVRDPSAVVCHAECQVARGIERHSFPFQWTNPVRTVKITKEKLCVNMKWETATYVMCNNNIILIYSTKNYKTFFSKKKSFDHS